MGFTLQVADQRDAFTLAEIGSFHGAESIGLAPLIAGVEDARLQNPYRITLAEGASGEARGLFDWLTSSAGSAALAAANHDLFGQVLYAPTLAS